jgi:hypothetical protein
MSRARPPWQTWVRNPLLTHCRCSHILYNLFTFISPLGYPLLAASSMLSRFVHAICSIVYSLKTITEFTSFCTPSVADMGVEPPSRSIAFAVTFSARDPVYQRVYIYTPSTRWLTHLDRLPQTDPIVPCTSKLSQSDRCPSMFVQRLNVLSLLHSFWFVPSHISVLPGLIVYSQLC